MITTYNHPFLRDSEIDEKGYGSNEKPYLFSAIEKSFDNNFLHCNVIFGDEVVVTIHNPQTFKLIKNLKVFNGYTFEVFFKDTRILI